MELTQKTLNALAAAQTATNKAVGEMATEITELAAALKHPNPDYCVMRQECAHLADDLHDHDTRLRVVTPVLAQVAEQTSAQIIEVDIQTPLGRTSATLRCYHYGSQV